MMLDPASQAHFDRLRARYFPSSINYLAAHVTLFHHLPGIHRAAIEARLLELCGLTPPAPFAVTGLRFLGRGTAYVLEVPVVAALRGRLASEWFPWLTAQDRQAWRPHVTVQNKVSPDAARRTHAELSAAFAGHQGHATGLQLWAYAGGPWHDLACAPFAGPVR